MPGYGSIWVITGRTRKRGNRYLRGDEEAYHIFPIHCREILVHSWMNFCLWRIVAAQHWQLMQHHVLFCSLWPCIARNMKRYKINEWRIQIISICIPTLTSSPVNATKEPQNQPPHDLLPNLPVLPLPSLSLSCWQTTLITAKDAPFKPSFHSQGCWDSLWIEAWCYSIKFRSFHAQSIYNMGLMGGGWGLSERYSTPSKPFVLVLENHPVNVFMCVLVWGFLSRLCAFRTEVLKCTVSMQNDRI